MTSSRARSLARSLFNCSASAQSSNGRWKAIPLRGSRTGKLSRVGDCTLSTAGRSRRACTWPSTSARSACDRLSPSNPTIKKSLSLPNWSRKSR